MKAAVWAVAEARKLGIDFSLHCLALSTCHSKVAADWPEIHRYMPDSDS